jgi:hypothetical protein
MPTLVSFAMSFKPPQKKDYADRAKAAMEAAAAMTLKGSTEFAIAPPGKSGYVVTITLAEILSTDKSITCNFSGDVSDPAGYHFGSLSGHSATSPSKDEAGDVIFLINDQVPKLITVRALPAIKKALTTNPGGGVSNPGGAVTSPPAKPARPPAHK